MAVRFVGFRLTIFRGFPTLGCCRPGWGIDGRTSDDPAARRIILCNPQMLMLEKRKLGQSADSQLEKSSTALFAEIVGLSFLIAARACCQGLLQQFPGLADELSHFEWPYQV